MKLFSLLLAPRLLRDFSASIAVPQYALGTQHSLLLMGFLFMRATLRWQPSAADWRHYFPHIRFERFRYRDNAVLLVQLVWLGLFKQQFCYQDWRLVRHFKWLKRCLAMVIVRFRHGLIRLMRFGVERWRDVTLILPPSEAKGAQRIGAMSLYVILAVLALLCFTVPFSLGAQALFVALLLTVAIVVRGIPGRLSNLVMIVISLIASLRYIWWRSTSTINWDNDLDLMLGLILLLAESYSWCVLLLSYFQTVWPLNRQPVALPLDSRTWPTIDLLIPTYNEDLQVVRATVLAASTVDWPKDKLNIYILDDGKRDDFQAFAEQVGVGYLRRPSNEHAKAGNLNYALKQTQGEFVAIFDCDHIPTRAFFQVTMGEFLQDPNLALVQTPHHFFSPDPFERNLAQFRRLPNEGNLFYGLIQDGNDMWDAAFFCGSCAVLRRGPLEQVGGIAVETVTEDAHTALKLHRLGYRSAYLREPIAAGLATDTLSAHIGQRIRWARGMAQIFRVDNPLRGKGLNWCQRLCYLNGMMHFLSGIPRIVFMLAPLAFLLLDAYIIYAPAIAIVLFVLPHMLHANFTNTRVQGKYRHSFWGEVYETVLAWYIAVPTTVALFAPHKGSFNVTAKGGLIKESFYDWQISKPLMALLLANMVGFSAAIYRLWLDPYAETSTVLINLFWTIYNLIVLSVALAVAAEARQVRETHRIEVDYPISILTQKGFHYPARLKDFSFGGVGVEVTASLDIQSGDTLHIALERYGIVESFACEVRFFRQGVLGLQLRPMTIEKERHYIQCTFARSDTWSSWRDGYQEDRPLESLKSLLWVSGVGFKKMFEQSPMWFRVPFEWTGRMASALLSMRPRWVE